MKDVICMEKSEIVILYKEVGKKVEFKKVPNDRKIFEDLVGGELDYILYEAITIIARKDREHLKPNIYINTDFLSIGTSIRGNIIMVCRKNENFQSLTKEQAMKYSEFLKRASFNYENFDEKGRYISKTKNNLFKDKIKFNLEKEIIESDKQHFANNETLKMILGIQTAILKFIKNNEN